MKKLKLTIKPNYKETPAERKKRVQNDCVSRANIYESKKKYNRRAYKNFSIDD